MTFASSADDSQNTPLLCCCVTLSIYSQVFLGMTGLVSDMPRKFSSAVSLNLTCLFKIFHKLASVVTVSPLILSFLNCAVLCFLIGSSPLHQKASPQQEAGFQIASTHLVSSNSSPSTRHYRTNQISTRVTHLLLLPRGALSGRLFIHP